ncbi:MAG TPA: hypothetical protein VEP48_09340 [Methylomirabilota bacterium]|nr:hypothetical protein [Methylomirabilota bacterium]
MRRAMIAFVTAVTLTMSGLTLVPALRATALGETSVTLNCDDGTGLTVSVDANALARLTAAVQAMIDYPAGLSCALIQNPLPPSVSFEHLALAATTNEFIVDGGRWLVGCSVILGGGNPTRVPSWIAARAGKGPGFASRITTAPSTDCQDPLGCVWVNIGVNLHFTGNGTLQGTLNETIPANQSCSDGSGNTIAVGPSHFTSKPTPPNTSLVGCLHVNATLHQAAVITYVTEISGLETFPGSGVAQGFFVGVGTRVRASFFDSQNSPSQQTPPADRDRLNAPPSFDDSDCPAQFDGTQFNVQQNGNINVHP